MKNKCFEILREMGYVKALTHEQEIIDLVNGAREAKKARKWLKNSSVIRKYQMRCQR